MGTGEIEHDSKSTLCLTRTISRAPAAFWRASATVMAGADPPVTTQAERDKVSEIERTCDWLDNVVLKAR